MLEFLRVVRQRKLLIAAVLAFSLLAGLVWTSRAQPVYQAKAEVLLRAPAVDPLDQQTQTQSATRTLNNEIQQITSTVAVDAVRKKYTGPLDPDIVKASATSADTDVITLTADAGNAADAAALLNTYIDAYIAYRSDTEVSALLAAGVTAQQKIDELQKAITAANVPLADLDRRMTTATGDELVRLRDQRQRLATDIEATLAPQRAQLAFYQNQLDRVQLTAGIRRAGSLVLLQPAEAPSAPISPDHVRDVAWALALGLVLALGAALVRDQLDDSVTDADMIASLTQLSTIGSIPKVKPTRGQAPGALAFAADPRSPSSEAFRILRTSLKFLRASTPIKVIQVTSPAAGEGKTLVASNLAAALATAGERVILVGCDLRQPGIDNLAGLGQGPGFTSVILGEADLASALWQHPEIPYLHVLRTGTLPPNPSDLLGSTAVRAVLDRLRAQYDWVILDTSPVLPVADARVTAPLVDAVLVVVRDGATSRRGLQRTAEVLRQADAPLMGAVLNVVGERIATYADRYEAAPSRAKSATPAVASKSVSDALWDDDEVALDDRLAPVTEHESWSARPSRLWARLEGDAPAQPRDR